MSRLVSKAALIIDFIISKFSHLQSDTYQAMIGIGRKLQGNEALIVDRDFSYHVLLFILQSQVVMHCLLLAIAAVQGSAAGVNCE